MSNYLFEDFLPEIKVAPVAKDIIARPYQVEAITAAFREWKTVASTLIVMPTGTGKSVVFAKILKQWLHEHMGRVMILAHRKELIAQAKAHAEAAGATCDIEMAKHWAGAKCDVVAASIQTLNAGTQCYECEGVNCSDCHVCGGSGKLKRMTRFDPRDFGLIITDECVVGSTRVALADGREETIERLFDGGTSVDVLSMNHDTGAIESKPLTGRKVSKTHQVAIVKLSDGRSIECTPDHLVYCERGYTLARLLTPKDIVLTLRHANTKTNSTGLRDVARGCSHEDRREVPSSSPDDSSFSEAIGFGYGEIRDTSGSRRDATKGTAERRMGRATICVPHVEQSGLHSGLADVLSGPEETRQSRLAVDGFGRGSCVVVHGRRKQVQGRRSNIDGRLYNAGTGATCCLAERTLGSKCEHQKVETIVVSHKLSEGWRSSVLQDHRAARNPVDALQVIRSGGVILRTLRRWFSSAYKAVEILRQDRVQKSSQGASRKAAVRPKPDGNTSDDSREVHGEENRKTVFHLHRDVPDWRRSQDSLRESGVQETTSAVVRCSVVSVEIEETQCEVYDLSVADNHNYFANGVLVHNCHHATADSYIDVYTWFGSNKDNKRLFVTATPERADGNGLHNVCESVAYEMDLRKAIDDGWLCPIRQQFIEVEGLDLSRVSTRQGDLADGELERAFIGEDDAEQEALLHSVVKPVIDIAGKQQFIVFASGVKHATLLLAAFNAYDGSRVEMVLGSTEPFERQEIVARLKSGATQGLVNVGVATEGFDCPAVAVVAIARPTKSTSLYMQMIGRGTRPLPGVVDGPTTPEARKSAIELSAKQTCVVLDFVGNSGNHKLVSVVDVLAGADVDARDLAQAVRLAAKADTPQDMDALLEKAKQAREAKEQAEEERRKLSTHRKADAVSMRATDVDLFGGKPFDAFRDYTPTHPNAATPKQVNYLVKNLGVSRNTAMAASVLQAGAMIDSMKKRTGGEFIITFGKHKAKPINQIPSGYLTWMMGGGISDAGIIGHVKTFLSERR